MYADILPGYALNRGNAAFDSHLSYARPSREYVAQRRGRYDNSSRMVPLLRLLDAISPTLTNRLVELFPQNGAVSTGRCNSAADPSVHNQTPMLLHTFPLSMFFLGRLIPSNKAMPAAMAILL